MAAVPPPAGKRNAVAAARGPGPQPPAPPPPTTARLTLLDVVALVAMNGCAIEVARCVDACKSMRTNAELWARVVDLRLAPVDGGEFHGERVTRLMHWAAVGDLARVREMLGRGAHVDARDANGRTALYRVARSGHVDVVRELVSRGADVDARAHVGWTALIVAAARSHTAVVHELVAHGADVNASDGDGGTPLIHAAIYGAAESAAELVRVGADVNAQDRDGWSPLVLASFSGKVDVVRVLLATPGIDVNLATGAGRTALWWARDRGRAEIASLLEGKGAC